MTEPSPTAKALPSTAPSSNNNKKKKKAAGGPLLGGTAAPRHAQKPGQGWIPPAAAAAADSARSARPTDARTLEHCACGASNFHYGAGPRYLQLRCPY